MSAPISHQIWDQKYRFKQPDGFAESALSETFDRVAKAAASVESPEARALWQRRFRDALAGFAFIPAGRILSGAGTGRQVTLFNCFAMGQIEDDMGSIFAHVREAALTLQQGGGIGHDFSTLRPKGAFVKGVGADASGPLSFMDVWDAMCRTIMSAGSRRGAMMGTLRCDHPDIEAFIEAKADPARLRMFNVSVLVTDPFMEAVKAGKSWDLVFGGRVFKTVDARTLWRKIMRSAYDYAEPGVIFIDRINARNRLSYCETIYVTNPCGEQPLPPYGACLLGSVNLAALVENPFTDEANVPLSRIEELVPAAVRLLDNIVDISRYPLPQQAEEARAKRRMGLGVTGLADALAMCGKHYASPEARALAAQWMSVISHAAYRASAELAREKGPFPLFDREAYLAQASESGLPDDIKEAIRTNGLRNGLLTSIAPTGTISLLAGNVSSGIEPIFELNYKRRILQPDGSAREEDVEDFAYAMFREKFGKDAPLPPAFVTAHHLSPRDHLLMQAAIQPHVDSSISKTVNCPESISFEAFESLYHEAYELGLKGCTAYRPNPVTGAVLTALPESKASGKATPRPEPAQAALPLPATPHAQLNGGGAGLSVPRAREPVLAGFTYKLKWPGSDHAIYVTINDEIEDGVRRPFEIFINSKNLEHYAWTVALTRMISAIFRRGGDISFVVEELKAVFDPRGGYWLDGKYVPSLLAAIGGIVERHLADIGFTQFAEAGSLSRPASSSATAMARLDGPQGAPAPSAAFCPRCGSPSLIFQEGCVSCRNCGYSNCA